MIARKDGAQVRLWARTTSDYSKAFTRIRDAVAALPVDSAVIDGEASTFPSRQYVRFRGVAIPRRAGGVDLGRLDLMEANRQAIRPVASGRAQEASGEAALTCNKR